MAQAHHQKKQYDMEDSKWIDKLIFDELKNEIDEQLNVMDEQLNVMDERLNVMDKRLNAINEQPNKQGFMPCFFCRSKSITIFAHNAAFTCICTACRAAGPISKSADEAKRLWNRRLACGNHS